MRRPSGGIAFEVFYEAEFAAVYRGVLAACFDSEIASDATQEAFSRALLRWRRLSRHEWAAGWVMTTALNEMRRLTRRPPASPVLERSVAPEDASTGVALNLELREAMEALTVRQRTIAVLFYWADLPTPAIAELTGISESAVRAHLTKARKTLRKELEVLVDGT